MFTAISLGATPLLENSFSQEMSISPEQSLENCERLIALIRLKFGYEPKGVKFVIVSPAFTYPHYYVVECHFDNEDFWAVQYIIRIKLDFPKTWGEVLKPFVSLN